MPSVYLCILLGPSWVYLLNWLGQMKWHYRIRCEELLPGQRLLVWNISCQEMMMRPSGAQERPPGLRHIASLLPITPSAHPTPVHTAGWTWDTPAVAGRGIFADFCPGLVSTLSQQASLLILTSLVMQKFLLFYQNLNFFLSVLKSLYSYPFCPSM